MAEKKKTQKTWQGWIAQLSPCLKWKEPTLETDKPHPELQPSLALKPFNNSELGAWGRTERMRTKAVSPTPKGVSIGGTDRTNVEFTNTLILSR